MPLIHVQIEDELLNLIDGAVKKLDVDRSKFVRHSLRYYLRSIETLPGPADADRPVVVIVQDNEVTK